MKLIDLTEMGRGVLDAQPFSRLLKARLVRLTSVEAELRIDVDDRLKQQHGFVHGGVVSYMADNALTFAGGAALGGGGVVTSEFKINYVRPAIGAVLIARAVVVASGRRQAVVRCDISCAAEVGEESVCAAAQGTITRLTDPAPLADPAGTALA